MTFNVISNIHSTVLPLIVGAVDKSSALIAWMTPFFALGITIYIIFHGFEVMRGGGGSSPFLDVIAKIARPLIVFHLAFASGMYSSTVVGFLVELRTDLTSLFGAKGGSYASLDSSMLNAWGNLVTGANIAFQNITFLPFNMNGFVMLVCLFIIGVMFLAYGLVAAFNLLVVDIGLAILFGLGPIFVACFAFQSTARFFDNWLSVVLKYTFTAVLMTVVVAVADQLINQYVTVLKASSDLDSLLWNTGGAILAVGLIIALIGKAAAIAADLTGGMSISLSGGGAVGKAVSTASSGAANAAGYVGGVAAGGAARYGSMAAGQVLGGSLGATVLKQTESMRAAVGAVGSKVAGSATGLGNAVAGRSVSGSGQVSSGHGVGNAFSIGRQLTQAPGRGTVTGSRK